MSPAPRLLSPAAATLAVRTLAVGTLAACAGRAPSPAPAPAPTPRAPAPAATPAPAPATDAATAWRFDWSTTAQHFVVRTEADVERSGGTAERERVESAAQVTLAIQTAGTGSARAVAARVDSLRVRTSERIAGGAASSPASGVGVRGTVSARGAVRLEVVNATALGGCTTPAGAQAVVAVALARETLPRIPAALTVGARWRDTLATATCAGPVPVAVQSVAAYEVEGRDGALLRVRRRTTSTLRGQGFAGGQAVRVTGTGTADATLRLDPALGALRDVAGEGRTTMAMTIGTATHTFEQRARLRVEAR
jgi:hypothetical protein